MKDTQEKYDEALKEKKETKAALDAASARRLAFYKSDVNKFDKSAKVEKNEQNADLEKGKKELEVA